MWLRTEEDDNREKGEKSNAGSSGSDANKGLTTNPDNFMGSDSSGGGNSYYTNEYEEDIRPTGGNRNAAAAAANRRRQMNAQQQNGSVPANIQQSAPISTPEEDDVPSLL